MNNFLKEPLGSGWFCFGDRFVDAVDDGGELILGRADGCAVRLVSARPTRLR
jgi:hypothetical protein